MNSVSRPRRPSLRASSASRWASVVAKSLLPALGLPRRAHPDRLVELRRAAVGAVHRQLGGAQARGAERVEESEQERAAVSAATGAGCDGEDRDVADVTFPALPEPGPGQPLPVVEHEPQGRVPALLLDPLAAPDLERLGDIALDLRHR